MTIAAAQRKWRSARNFAIVQWVRNFEHVATRVVNDGRQSDLAGVFWIGLYAVVAELPELMAGDAAGKADEIKLALRALASDSLQAFLDSLTDDDRILIEYFRNTVVHIWLEGFHGGFGLTPRLPEVRNILGKSTQVPRAEIESRLDNLINRHLVSAPGSVTQFLAFQYATRLKDHISSLAKNMGRLFSR